MLDLDAIVRRHRPKGYRLNLSRRRNRLVEQRQLHPSAPQQVVARCDPNKKRISAPYPVDPDTLSIILHEFAHVHLKHWGSGLSTSHREEFEAERWAMEIMRLEGVPVPLSVRKSARRYVRECIDRDEKAGIPIEKHVRKWAFG